MNTLLSRVRSLLIASAVLLGLLVPLFANATAADAAQTSSTLTWERNVAYDTLSQLNRERAAYHLRPLSMDSSLVSAAWHHNVRMAQANTMSHQVPNPYEAPLGSRLDAANYRWVWAGENVAWNSALSTAGVLALQSMMYNEKAPNNGHRLNILSSHFTNVGVNVIYDAAHHKVWLTTDFGSK